VKTPVHMSTFYTQHWGKSYWWTTNPETGRAMMVPMVQSGLPGGVGPMPPSVREMEVELSD
jgi:hypothetical protein